MTWYPPKTDKGEVLRLIGRARDDLLIAMNARTLVDRHERIAWADERLAKVEDLLRAPPSPCVGL